MPGINVRFTEEDKQKITERMREIARFKEGDKVTVEPQDSDIAYAGHELEGVLLTVDDVFWNGNGLRVPDDERQGPPMKEEHKPDNYEERHVELSGDYEYYVHDRVYISKIRYTFKEGSTHSMSEFALIPWSEYRNEHDRVKLLSEGSDDEKHWLEPFEDGNCEVCGCNMAEHWYWDNGVVNAGGHKCAACGDVKEQHAP